MGPRRRRHLSPRHCLVSPGANRSRGRALRPRGRVRAHRRVARGATARVVQPPRLHRAACEQARHQHRGNSHAFPADQPFHPYPQRSRRPGRTRCAFPRRSLPVRRARHPHRRAALAFRHPADPGPDSRSTAPLQRNPCPPDPRGSGLQRSPDPRTRRPRECLRGVTRGAQDHAHAGTASQQRARARRPPRRQQRRRPGEPRPYSALLHPGLCGGRAGGPVRRPAFTRR